MLISANMGQYDVKQNVEIFFKKPYKLKKRSEASELNTGTNAMHP